MAAVFILVVLAALAGYIVSSSTTQNLTMAQDVMNSRAFQAARTGLEWATYQVTHPSTFRDDATDGCVNPDATYAGTKPATEVFAAGDLAGLDAFRVEVVCRSEVFNEAGASYRVYQLTATACNAAACPSLSPPAVGYVEHRQTATVRQ